MVGQQLPTTINNKTSIIMNETEFAELYLKNEEHIHKVLNSLEIFDEDLLHDTYIALYEDAQVKVIRNFANAFIAYFQILHFRQMVRDSRFETYDDNLSYVFDRADTSNTDSNEQVGQRVDAIIDYYCTHPPKGARNHECACKILKLYCRGLTVREIAKELGLGKSTVQQYIDCIVRQIKRQYGQ